MMLRRIFSWTKLRAPRACRFLLTSLLLVPVIGCSDEEGIRSYTIPKTVPQQLLPGKERLLAAMVPRGNQVWFFKITGPDAAVVSVDSSFRQFIQSIQFGDSGDPILKPLPESWRLGGKKPMRFATVNIDTENKQLELAVSSLTVGAFSDSEYEDYVNKNVNRWRGQVGLTDSDETWAGGEPIEIASADRQSILVDVVGEAKTGSASMMPPMMQSMNQGGGSPGPVAKQPTESAGSDYEYDVPAGWQDLGPTGIRELSLTAGPADAKAEIAVFTLGGDLRSNVARWMGQVAGGTVADPEVDQMLEDADIFDVSGHQAQRFIIAGDGETNKISIDATIIPLENGFSKFIKMTGPPETVTQQGQAMKQFLESLSF